MEEPATPVLASMGSTQLRRKNSVENKPTKWRFLREPSEDIDSTRSVIEKCTGLSWLDWIFWGWYLPSLSINYVGMSKDMEKRLPQLYYLKMKISYDLGFIAIGVAMAT